MDDGRIAEREETQAATLDPERMRAFARQIIFTGRMHDLIGVIHDPLARSQIAGRDPLLRACAKRAFEQIKNDPANGLDPAYVHLEAAVDGLLADQRKGFLPLRLGFGNAVVGLRSGHDRGGGRQDHRTP